MERDLAAIQAKLDSLESEAQMNEKEHPEEAVVIRERIEIIQKDWEELTQMVKNNNFYLIGIYYEFPLKNNCILVKRKRF